MDCQQELKPAPSMECFSEETKSLLESSGQLRPELYRQKAKQRILDLEHEVAQRIRLLKDEIWALQVSRNDGIPIALLPAEILSKIFLEVAFLTLANSALPGQEKVTWIHLTHVCHQWRIVALNCPSLWSFITLTGSITMTRIMLARSKKHSLTVAPPKHLNLLKPQGRWESLNLALLETNRLRAIELNSDFNGVEPQHLEVAFQGKDLPILEKIVLTSSGSSHRIPQKFLQSSRTPALKHLEVVGYIILWDPLPSATGLTFLKLHHSFAIQGERPSEKLLFKALDQMPHLQYLDLSRFLPQESSDHTPSSNSARRLQSLELLTLRDAISSISNFLVSVDNFRARQVRLYVLDEQRSTEPLSRCIDALGNTWMDSEPNSTKARARQGVGELRMHDLDFAPILKSWFGKRSKRPADLTISLIHSGRPTSLRLPPSDILGVIADHLDLSPLISLRVSCCPFLKSVWKRVFGHLPSLKSVTFMDNYTFSDFIRVLRSRPKGSEAQPYFPALTTVKCFELNFAVDQENVVKTLAEALNARPRTHRVHELHIEECVNFTKESHDFLRNSLSTLEVVWDGKEDIEPIGGDSEEEEVSSMISGYH